MRTIDELDQKVERIVKKTVKHYYTDWKNYDRPKYMGLKRSADRKDKDLLLLVRTCGTYLIRTADVYRENWATTIFEYFQTQEKSDYYHIDLGKLTVKKIEPAAFGRELRKVA